MMSEQRKRALVAMRGGVDSSVAASIMVEAGYEAIGATMMLYHNEDVGYERGRTCCSLDDVLDARAVCDRLGIPHYTMNFTEDFRKNVMCPFVEEYRAGRTPNPCIECNRSLKFARLLHRANELSADCIVTGHYARVVRQGSRMLLERAADASKDQSYVLYMLTQDALSRIMLPLGDLTKDDVRQIASRQGFQNAKKRDSQDICFVPDGDYGAFIERFTGRKSVPGNFVDEDGRILGTHRGVVHYTIGQRRGLRIAMNRRMYVKKIDPASNTVTLSDDASLYRRELDADHINLIAMDRIDGTLRASVRVRYSQKAAPAQVIQTDDDRIHVIFDEPQRAIAPGQAAVIYDDDVVIGGGTIL